MSLLVICDVCIEDVDEIVGVYVCFWQVVYWGFIDQLVFDGFLIIEWVDGWRCNIVDLLLIMFGFFVVMWDEQVVVWMLFGLGCDFDGFVDGEVYGIYVDFLVWLIGVGYVLF